MICEKLTINRNTMENDGFGGSITKAITSFYIFGKINITNDDLKPLPSGYGFYKKVVVLTVDELLPNDKIVVGNTSFHIVSGKSSKRMNIYYGVQDA